MITQDLFDIVFTKQTQQYYILLELLRYLTTEQPRMLLSHNAV